MNTIIKPINEAFMEDAIELLNNAHNEKTHMKKEKLKKEMSYLNKLTMFFGLFLEDELIGMIGLENKNEKDYKLIRLAVSKSYQNNGYGESLVRYIEDKAIILGGQSMSLGYKNNNTFLKDWYKKLGYEIQKIKAFGRDQQEICFVKKRLSKRPMLEPINKKVSSCKKCGFPNELCICNTLEEVKIPFEIAIVMHAEEAHRQTNTGFLILDSINENGKCFYWERSSDNKSLDKMINDPNSEIILVFPKDGYIDDEKMVSMEELKIMNKKVVFIIIDGTWKEARKILRKTPILNQLKRIELKELEETKYTLRRNKDMDHICTVEVAIELMKGMGCDKSAMQLTDSFRTFLDRYERAKSLQMKTSENI